jgi:hypothetical protein
VPARTYRNANAAPVRRPRRHRLQRSPRHWIAGTLIELDPARKRITVRVQCAGYPLPAPGTELTVDVSSARIRASDGDGDGRAGLTDLFPGDRVRVTLRSRSRSRSRPRREPSALRVQQTSPGAPRGGLKRVWR